MLTPSRIFVISAPVPSNAPRRTPALIRFGPWGFPECSGQRWPTGAGVMHSAQIGRPHSEHETNVSRSGCR
jgi:hypothetical protein